MAERLGEIYAQKYWIAWLGFFRPSARVWTRETSFSSS